MTHLFSQSFHSTHRFYLLSLLFKFYSNLSLVKDILTKKLTFHNKYESLFQILWINHSYVECKKRRLSFLKIKILIVVSSGTRQSHRFRELFLSVKLLIFSYQSVFTYVMGAQKKCLIEMVFLSTHNICFGLEIRFFEFFSVRTLQSLYINLHLKFDQVSFSSYSGV